MDSPTRVWHSAPSIVAARSAVTDTNPVPLAELFTRGSMSLELYAPHDVDGQSPHRQDEVYVVAAGSATLTIEGAHHAMTAGSVGFVAAGEVHRFTDMSEDFATWVLFWGPDGGDV